MNISRLNQREKLMGLSTAILIIGSLFYTSILEPQIKKHRSLKNNFNNLKVKYTKMQTDVLMRDRIDHAYKQVHHLIETTGTEQQQISLFTRELSNIYSDQNVIVKSVKILPSHIESHYTQLTLKVELTGNIKNFLRLVSHLESLNKPIRVESFTLDVQDATDTIHVSLVITKIVKISKA